MAKVSKRLATDEGLKLIADAIKNTEAVQQAKAEIQAEGVTQVANVQAAAEEIVGKVEQIEKNTEDVAELKTDLATYAIIRKPDSELEWCESGFYRVTNRTKLDNASYVISNPISVSTGQTIYAYGEVPADYYLLLAYDNNFKIVFDNCVGSKSVSTKNVTYVVPDGISYIRLTTKKEEAYLADIQTVSVRVDDAVDGLYIANDVNSIQFVKSASFNTTTKRPAKNGNRICSRCVIPIGSIVEIGIKNSAYKADVGFYNSDMTLLQNVTIGSVVAPKYPQNTKYFSVTLYASGYNADTMSVEDSGFYVLSTKCKDSVHEIDTYNDNFIGSWDTTTLTKATTISNPIVELMAHGSSVYDGGDGYIYVAYYANHDNHTEGIGQDIRAKIAKIATWDFGVKTIYECGKKDITIGDFINEGSCYDPVLIQKSSGIFSVIYQCKPQGESYTTISLDFNTNTGECTNARKSYFKYTINGTTQTVVMNADNMTTFLNTLLGTTGKYFGALCHLQHPILYNGAYYAYLGGGLQTQNANTGYAGCIIKTTDYGHTWEFVSYDTKLTNKVACCWEGCLDISADGKAYCVMRAIWNNSKFTTYCIANVYDIVNDTWSETYFINGSFNDGSGVIVYDSYYTDSGNRTQIYTDTSRPLVSIIDGYVYFFDNVNPRLKTSWKTEGVYRSTMRVYKHDLSSMDRIWAKSYQSDSGVHYFANTNIRGRQYMTFTRDERHLDNNVKGDIAIIPLSLIIN